MVFVNPTQPLIHSLNYIDRKKEHIILVSLDLSKAFDTFNTSSGILQDKNKYYTKNDKITNWIDTFYKERKQFTVWDDARSKLVTNHNISIVQGSSMGPKLFNIHLNDLPNVNNKLEVVLLADDSNFMLSDTDPIKLSCNFFLF